MKSIKLMIGIFFLPAIFLSLCGCISSNLKGQVLDKKGNPIADAYIVYGYVGVESKIVDADHYHRPGTIIKTDSYGNFTIPPLLYVRNPIFQYKLSPKIYAIYDPKTHSVGTLPSKGMLDYGYLTRDGLKEFKRLYWWFEIKEIENVNILVFDDVSNDPAKWYSSIRQLREAFEYCDAIGYWDGWRAPFEQRTLLYNRLIYEYEIFKNKYGDKPCGSIVPENSRCKTFGELISYDFELYLNNYEKKIFEKKN